MPPEILNEEFDQNSLSWTVGMIFYFLVAGIFPFDGPNDCRIGKENAISFDSKAWNGVDGDIIELVKQLLEEDSKKRVDLEEIPQKFENILDKKISISENEKKE